VEGIYVILCRKATTIKNVIIWSERSVFKNVVEEEPEACELDRIYEVKAQRPNSHGKSLG